MKIIISPAKQMVEELEILAYMQGLSYEEAKKLWDCNDKIAEENFQRFADMDLEKRLTPAILAYDGIAFKYMAPNVFAEEEFAYVQDHLRILSGFYGSLKPMDGSRIIINLASKEYSKCVEKFLQPEDTFVTCVFGELNKGKVQQKGVYAPDYSDQKTYVFLRST